MFGNIPKKKKKKMENKVLAILAQVFADQQHMTATDEQNIKNSKKKRHNLTYF